MPHPKSRSVAATALDAAESANTPATISVPALNLIGSEALSSESPEEAARKKSSAGHDYKGFVAGVFSGIAKLSGKAMVHQNSSARLWVVAY